MGSSPTRGTTDKSIIVADVIDKTEATARVGTEKNPMAKKMIIHMLNMLRLFS